MRDRRAYNQKRHQREKEIKKAERDRKLAEAAILAREMAAREPDEQERYKDLRFNRIFNLADPTPGEALRIYEKVSPNY